MGDRRNFIKKSTLATFSTLLGTSIVFGENLSAEYKPLFLDHNDPQTLFGKHKEMTTLNDRPWNIEAKAHLLDDAITLEDRMFIRNNGIIPKNIDAANWTLTVEGESASATKSRPIPINLL